MIYDMHTWQLVPGALPDVLRRLGEACEARKKFTDLAACWFTELGPLNRIVAIWQFDSVEDRARRCEQAERLAAWPRELVAQVAAMESVVFTRCSFSPPFRPDAKGPYYELRQYKVKPETKDDLFAAWSERIDARVSVSPLSVAMYAEGTEADTFVHIWPYETLNQRKDVRDYAIAAGLWPPRGGADRFLSQENMILLPAPFSPAQ